MLVLILLLVVVSCSDQMTFTDSQGNAYTAVKIGGQVWMAENLNYKVAGDSYCYSDDPSSCDEMGRLYTWRAAKEAAEAIDGWHLPSKEEWKALLAICGEDSVGFVNITSEKYIKTDYFSYFISKALSSVSTRTLLFQDA